MIIINSPTFYGAKEAIRGMRNSYNSWGKSDSKTVDGKFIIGERDLELMHKLSISSSDHRKFLRMMIVYMDITAPLYWWKEFDTYKVGTVANSCSTMHRITAKPFEIDDFSHDQISKDIQNNSDEYLIQVVRWLNNIRDRYLLKKDKQSWWDIIQLLPSSYNQTRTVMLNYEVLKNIYFARQSHKLDEWKYFCDYISTFPNANELIISK